MRDADAIDADATRQGLLAMCGPVRAVDEPRGSKDERVDWNAILAIATRHRLLPLLHWRLKDARGEAVGVPPDVARMLQREMVASTQATLRVLAGVRLIDDALSSAGVPVVFLKGVHLAAGVYPQPGLRPMRDIDVLVPSAKIAQAVDAMRGLGAVVSDGVSEEFHARRHHLPAIELPGSGIRVEVHWDLRPRARSGTTHCPAPPAWEELSQRAGQLDCAGHLIRVLSREDLLVHLVGHAVIDHRLSNGPLLLADLGFLLEKGSVDWNLVWRLAEEQRLVRPCELVLRLVERYWGVGGIEWCGHDGAVADAALDAAVILMTQESVLTTNVAAAREGAEGAGQVPSLVRLAARRLFIPRRDLALLYPVKAGSLAAFAWYPRHWWRLATKRLPEYLRYRRKPGVDIDVKALGVLEAWLQRKD